MFLHRIVEVGPGPFVPDPLWSSSQVVPPALSLPEQQISGGGSGGTIYWWAVPYNGADPDTAVPTDGTGMTFDARFVYVMTPSLPAGKTNRVVIGRTSPGEVTGGPIPIGREVIEFAPPRGAAGTLQMLSVAGVPGPVTHLWLFWSFEPRGGV